MGSSNYNTIMKMSCLFTDCRRGRLVLSLNRNCATQFGFKKVLISCLVWARWLYYLVIETGFCWSRYCHKGARPIWEVRIRDFNKNVHYTIVLIKRFEQARKLTQSSFIQGQSVNAPKDDALEENWTFRRFCCSGYCHKIATDPFLLAREPDFVWLYPKLLTYRQRTDPCLL